MPTLCYVVIVPLSKVQLLEVDPRPYGDAFKNPEIPYHCRLWHSK
jgi:hypothetical protein